VDYLRIGRIARALRQRLGMRQEDVSLAAGCSQDEVSLLERGRIQSMTLRRLQRVFGVFDAEVVIYVRWRGGSLDRLLDARHAALAEATVRRLTLSGWTVVPRGVVFGLRRARFDRSARLAPGVTHALGDRAQD
jgi:transcriptional regulator with XRE-family HTH domain